MKPFNLKEALEGKPVITRDGKEVTQLTHFKDVKDKSCIIAVIRNEIMTFTTSGSYYINYESNLDLFMAPTKTKYYVHVYKPTYHSDTIYSAGPTKKPWNEFVGYGNLIQTFEFEIDE